MHYEEYGDVHNHLMMFIHGGGVGGWMWDQQVQYFSNYHCVVPELMSQSPFSIEQCAKELLLLIEKKANGQPVIVIGFSLGAQIAVQMLSIKPWLIDFAIINSALVIPSPTMERMLQPFIRLTFPLMKNKTFAKLQAKALYVNDDYFERYYHDSSTMKVDALIQILRENMTFSIPHDFHKAQGRILITVGDKEKSIMKKSAKALVRSHSNSSGVILNNIGHGVSLADPAFFNRFVENWISQGQLPEGIAIQ
ncbi:alpha/beta fold hydrolase [Lysinibacillus cavernae]|uniref:alpha/beta fold hydrolase n=1 Tax=Lysinibacillus cavernae TaxID=2666135 RepID=UPI0012D97C79|nr:alpha/beta hydrolase [Lysinibacillus cavernae]